MMFMRDQMQQRRARRASQMRKNDAEPAAKRQLVDGGDALLLHHNPQHTDSSPQYTAMVELEVAACLHELVSKVIDDSVEKKGDGGGARGSV